MSTDELTVDPKALRTEIRDKYRELALNPTGDFHFPTGAASAARLGYPADVIDALPDEAVASFAGTDNPFAAGPLPEGSRVVDLGSGGGFDCLVAGRLVGPTGHVIGVDMTPEMLARARRVADSVGASNVEYREGILEQLPVEDESVDVVMSNGVLNLVADKARVFAEARRVLRPGGVLQFADIAVGIPVPAEAQGDINLWTGCIAGARTVDEWCALIRAAGFGEVAVGHPTDTFGGAEGEAQARAYEVQGHTFRARAQ